MITFGTGGWRDRIAENFTFANVRLFAQGISDYIADRQQQAQGLVIGYDNRFLSEDFAIVAAEVFAGNGIHVLLLPQSVPTPLVTYVTERESMAAGLMFTASHNSAAYHGIKLVCKGGLPASVSVTTELERRMNSIRAEGIRRMDFEHAMAAGIIRRVDYHHEFVECIEQSLDMDRIRETKLNVLYDPMYGTGAASMIRLLTDARCRFSLIHDRHDPLFGGRDPAPSQDTLWRLMGLVREGAYDIGLATDGDADRLAIIDHEGTFIHPNEILSMLYYYFLEYRGERGGIVRSVCTTHRLDRIAAAYGEKCMETPVGFKHIATEMQASNAFIGGESSGGMTIRGQLLEKNGILAAGLILEMMAVTGMSLKEMRRQLTDRFGSFYFVESHLAYSYEKAERLRAEWEQFTRSPAKLYDLAVVSQERMDGVKWVLEDGSWICCRFSGTEPVLRLMAEADDDVKAVKLIEAIANLLQQQLG